MENNEVNKVMTDYSGSESSDNRKCPSCGATLRFDPQTGGLSCEFCGRHVDIHQQIQPPGVGYTLEEINNAAGAHYLQKSKIATCATCGGRFLIAPSGISGVCPYCGSNSLNETEDQTGMLEPTGVLPFKISRDEAQKIFEDWIKNQRFVPSDLLEKARATGMNGVYVPYWVFDAETRSAYDGKFGYSVGSGNDEYIKWKKKSGVYNLVIKGYTVIASQRLANDRFWQNISKFNMNFMKKYDRDILAGFSAERYTIDGPAAWLTFCDQTKKRIRQDIIRKESADRAGEINFEPEYSKVRVKYCLAPIWTTAFKYNDQVYHVLINGQTGDITGRCPKSLKWLGRVFLIIGIIVGSIFAIEFVMTIIRAIISAVR